MRLESFHDLIAAYLDTLTGRTQTNQRIVAKQWLLTLTTLPTRTEILAPHKAKGQGHFESGASSANTELALLRAACRWGIYQECWEGGDPTVGIKKWQTPRRKRVAKFDELTRLLEYFDRAFTDREILDRALFGLMLFTGCRPGEARTAPLHAITQYGDMGAWIKGKTKTGETQEIPLPTQLMPWIDAWKAIRPTVPASPYLFPGGKLNQPVGLECIVQHWHDLSLLLGLHGLWNYDLRPTLACYLSNELGYDDVTIRAILNHADGSSLGHYCFKSFDSLKQPIQAYANWLCALKQEPAGNRDEPAPLHRRPVIPIPASPPPPSPVLVPPVAEVSDEKDPPILSAREGEVLA